MMVTTQAATHAIETVGLTRRFGKLEAISGLSLSVPTGRIFALIGPNGAGKTTTLKVLVNLLKPTSGSARVLGIDTRHIDRSILQRIGYVSENQRLLDWMTPTELFAYCRPLYPNWDDELRHRLQRDLRLSSNARLRDLSRGTRMKAALLASVAYRPELVLLDEPFSGLDPLARDELADALSMMASERPFTCLIASHDIDEIERLATWVGYIDQGRVLFSEPVAALLKRHRLVEVGTPGGGSIPRPAQEGWLVQGAAEGVLRFIDAHHDAPDAMDRIVAAYPALSVRTSPLSLREIFVAMARESARSEAIAGAAR
jgi:ABC-2 type transport system ATP-binding protein